MAANKLGTSQSRPLSLLSLIDLLATTGLSFFLYDNGRWPDFDKILNEGVDLSQLQF